MTVPEVAPRSRAQSAWANAVAAYINAHIDEIAALTLGIAGLDDTKVDKAGDSMEGPLHVDLSDYTDGSNFIGVEVTPKSTNSATGGAVHLNGAGANEDITVGNYLGELKAAHAGASLSAGRDVALVEGATFTPVFSGSGMTVGNATVSGRYVWIGGKQVGAVGHIMVSARFTVGSGTTIGTSLALAMPSGFEILMASSSGLAPIGGAEFLGATRHNGPAVYNGATNISIFRWAASTQGQVANVNATNPITFATGNTISVFVSVIAQRV